MSGQNLLTVALPVYNGQEYLAEALASLLAQSYANFRLVISDNGSTDQTLHICELFCRNDSRVSYIRHTLNRGPSWNFTYLLNIANTKYFMWAASDDLWHINYVESCMMQLAADPEIAIAASLVTPFSDHAYLDPYRQLSELPAATRWQTRQNYLRQPEENGKANLVYGIFRTDVLKLASRRKLFNECWGADMLLVYRCLTFGRLSIFNQPLFYKRRPLSVCPPPSSDSPTPATHERYAFAALIATLKNYSSYYWNYILVDIADDNSSCRQKFILIRDSVSLFSSKVWRDFVPLLNMIIRHRRDVLNCYLISMRSILLRVR